MLRAGVPIRGSSRLLGAGPGVRRGTIAAGGTAVWLRTTKLKNRAHANARKS